METPTGIMKENWSLGAHYLCEVYEEQEDVDAYISALHAGTADLANNAKWNAKMDTFDVLKKYNYAANSLIAAEREVTEQNLILRDILYGYRPGNGGPAVSHAADIDPVLVPAALHCRRRDLRGSYTADRQDLQWCPRESIWLAVCSRVVLQI